MKKIFWFDVWCGVFLGCILIGIGMAIFYNFFIPSPNMYWVADYSSGNYVAADATTTVNTIENTSAIFSSNQSSIIGNSVIWIDGSSSAPCFLAKGDVCLVTMKQIEKYQQNNLAPISQEYWKCIEGTADYNTAIGNEAFMPPPAGSIVYISALTAPGNPADGYYSEYTSCKLVKQ